MFVRHFLGGDVFLVLCSAVATIACRDIYRPADLRAPEAGRLAETPPTLLSLTCELSRSSVAVWCRTNVIDGSAPRYAQFQRADLVRDTVAHTWQFAASVRNLLQQSIGTLDGTTVMGVTVFITALHVTAGTGAVSVTNADGVGTFAAPNQPYFAYGEIVAPNGYTANKLWKFDVPNSVTAVSMSVIISADFPAKQGVTPNPPSSLPAWVHSDANTSERAGTPAIPVQFTKQIVLVYFRSTATLTDRQLAIAYVNGTVVGGKLYADGTSGYYAVQVADDGSGSGLLSARARLRSLLQVETAVVEGRLFAL